MESIGFKEWALICEALGRGRQSVILRKGGIAEGGEGFSFRYQEFFLFPTFFHEQLEKTRLRGATLPERRETQIDLRFLAKVEMARRITAWEVAESLEPLHVLKPEVVRERFQYDDAPGLHVALVRVFQLNPGWILPESKSYGGCRSWVKLPAPPADLLFHPVLDEIAHENKRRQFLKCIGR